MARLPAYLRRNIRLIDVHSHTGLALNYFTHGFPFCHDLRSSHEENRRIGVTHAVVFPYCTSLYYDLRALQRAEVRLGGKIGNAPFHFENEQMLRQLYEIFPGYRHMFIPFVCVDPQREVRRQVKVLSEQLTRHRFYGLKIHPRATQTRLLTLGREGRPLLDFARANDLPILLHTAYPGSPDRYSKISDLLIVARENPKVRFCAAHFCGFHQPTFDEVARYDNIWVDAAALSIGCDLVRKKSPIYESGPARIRADYRHPAKVFATIARRYPHKFMWGTDNPAHSYVSHAAIKPNGPAVHLELWSSMEREKALLAHVRGRLRHQVTVANALDFLEG